MHEGGKEGLETETSSLAELGKKLFVHGCRAQRGSAAGRCSSSLLPSSTRDLKYNLRAGPTALRWNGKTFSVGQ